jgi:hypothetical protein
MVAIGNLRFKISLVLTVNNLVFLVLFGNLMKGLMLIGYLTTKISHLSSVHLMLPKMDLICYVKLIRDG